MAQIEFLLAENKAIREQKELLLNVSKVMKNQLDLAIQLKAAVVGGGDVAKTQEAYLGLSKVLDGASEAAERHEKGLDKLGGMSEKVKKQILGVADGSDKASKSLGAMAVAGAAMGGAFKGLEFTTNIMSGFGGIISTIGGAVFDLAKTVIAFPFSLWDGLFSKAAAMQGSTAWRQALENIRKEFGNLATGSSKAMIDMTKSMRGQLDETGLRVRRIFGNRAEILTWITGVAKSMGNMFQLLRDKGQLADKDVERFGALYKGLGISEEGMKAVAREALLSGKTVVAQMTDMANYAIQMGKAYGINAKEISKDMQSMMLDLKHFGGLSKKAMGEASIYARKLGMDIKDLAGLLDTFDTLDAGMEASAKLNQSLGLNLNGLELMNAAAKGGPAEVAEAVRKSMKEQGFSIATLNRQQQNMMASTLGLTNEQLQLMDVQNKGASLEDIKKKGAAAQKAQLSQAEATQMLASSIERLVKEMEPLQKGLFAAFFDGFQKGVFRSMEFRKILLEIRQVLWIVTRAGREVGFAFVQMFPGVKEIFRGIQDFFSPQRWRAMMKDVVKTFKEFFTDMQNNPEAGLKKLFEKLKVIFFNHFDNSNPAGMKVIAGFKTFFTSILKAVIGGAKAMIPVVMEALTKLLKGITVFLKGGIPDSFTAGAGGIGEQVLAALSDLWKTIKKSWPALKEAALELLGYLKDTIWNWAMENKMLIAGVLGIMMAPSIISSVIGAGMSLIGGLFVKGLLGTAKTVGNNPAVREGLSSIFRRSAGAASANPVPGTPSITKPPGGSPPSVASALKWAAYIAIGMAAIVSSILLFAKAIELLKIQPAALAMSVAVVIASIPILAAMTGLAAIVSSSQSIISSATKGLLPLSLFTAGVTLLIGGLLWLTETLTKTSPEESMKSAKLLGVMTLVLMAMAPLALEAAAFSLLMSSGPIALIGAAAITAGLTAMGLMAVKVIDTAKQIIEAARSINMSSGIEDKVKLVLSVIEALGGFARSVAAILKTLPLEAGIKSDAFQRALNGITQFIEEIKTKMVNFVKIIVEIASGVPTENLNKISAVVNIIKSLTGAIASIGKVLTDSKSTLGSLIAGDLDYQSMMIWMKAFLGEQGPMPELLGAVRLLVIILSNPVINIIRPEALKSLGDTIVPLIGSIAKLAADLATAFSGSDSWAAAIADPARRASMTFAVQSVIATLFGENTSGRESGILKFIGDLIGKISIATVLIRPADIPKIQAIAALLGAVFSSLSFMSGVLSAGATKQANGSTSFAVVENVMRNTLSSMGTFFDSFMMSIISVTAKITNVKELKSKVDVMITAMKFVGDFSSILNSINWMAKGAAGAGNSAATGLANLANLIDGGRTGGTTIFDLLSNIMTKMSTGISRDQVRAAEGSPNLSRVIAKIANLSKATGELSSLSSNIGEIGELSTKITVANAMIGTVGGDAMGNISRFIAGDTQGGGHGLIGMVDRVNQLNRALSGINTVNIDTKLRSVGTILGITNTKPLEINSKAFNLTVNFKILMDATTIENVIAERAVNHSAQGATHRSPFTPDIVNKDQKAGFENM